jgi:pre-mRNA-splicing helicase BRR2
MSRGEDSVSYYRPKTTETQRVYEMMLTFITDCIGSQPRDVVCGAADEILQIMKNDHIQVT